MTTEQFVLWLAQWLSRHPVKPPGAASRASYTQEVMSRIEALSQPSSAPRRLAWRLRPQWILAMGGAAAAAAVMLTVGRHPNPAIGPRPSAVGPSASFQRMGGRDVAPRGASDGLPRLPAEASAQAGALPVGLHAPLAQVEPADGLSHLAQVLSGSGEDPSEVLAEVEAGDPEDVAAELTTIDRLMLAEAPEAAGALRSLWQELETLNQLEDESGDESELMDDESDESADELLEELEWMDSASSASS